jgi:phage repressor protein C with HTH and peptisase S24 domain
MIAAVKRIRRSEQGFVILSENREYLPEITTLDWPDLCVGRVVWMWRSLEEVYALI